MKMLKVSQCKKNFDFKPQNAWPKSLPAFSWGEELVCDFEAPPEKDVVDLKTDEAKLAPIFADIHRNLSLAELARIYKFLHEKDFVYLLEKNSLRYSESLTDLLQKIDLTPPDFQAWTSERKLGPKELFILKAVNSFDDVASLLTSLASQNPTRQFGIKILETGVELFLMGHALSSLLPVESEASEQWCERLEKLRHPIMTLRMAEKQLKLAELPWPKFISAKVVQQQASLVSEIRLQFRNTAELKRNIEALQRVQSVIESGENLS